MAPAAFLAAWLHAHRALGPSRATLEMGALIVYGFALECAAMKAFSAHDYGEAWNLAPLGIPVAVVAVWAALITSAMALAARLGWRSPLARAAAAALIGIALDLTMEPVAVRSGLWRWTPPGAWLGVPMGNFVGWAVIVGSYAWGAERWAKGGRLRLQALRRLGLATASVAALLIVGGVWRAWGLEPRFDERCAWLTWGGLLVLTASLGLARPGVALEDSLGGRLGAARGPSPAVVLAWLLTAFAADAALLADPTLGAVALGSVVALFPALRRGAVRP